MSNRVLCKLLIFLGLMGFSFSSHVTAGGLHVPGCETHEYQVDILERSRFPLVRFAVTEYLPFDEATDPSPAQLKYIFSAYEGRTEFSYEIYLKIKNDVTLLSLLPPFDELSFQNVTEKLNQATKYSRILYAPYNREPLYKYISYTGDKIELDECIAATKDLLGPKWKATNIFYSDEERLRFERSQDDVIYRFLKFWYAHAVGASPWNHMISTYINFSNYMKREGAIIERSKLYDLDYPFSRQVLAYAKEPNDPYIFQLFLYYVLYQSHKMNEIGRVEDILRKNLSIANSLKNIKNREVSSEEEINWVANVLKVSGIHVNSAELHRLYVQFDSEVLGKLELFRESGIIYRYCYNVEKNTPCETSEKLFEDVEELVTQEQRELSPLKDYFLSIVGKLSDTSTLKQGIIEKYKLENASNVSR